MTMMVTLNVVLVQALVCGVALVVQIAQSVVTDFILKIQAVFLVILIVYYAPTKVVTNVNKRDICTKQNA
jgi:hypothetical protein